jgi:hypothetical protein
MCSILTDYVGFSDSFARRQSRSRSRGHDSFQNETFPRDRARSKSRGREDYSGPSDSFRGRSHSRGREDYHQRGRSKSRDGEFAYQSTYQIQARKSVEVGLLCDLETDHVSLSIQSSSLGLIVHFQLASSCTCQT